MNLDELITDLEDVLLADGFGDALIGIGTQFNRQLAVYDWDKCVAILQVHSGMSYDEAVEYMDFNVTGAFVGENTPVFVRRGSLSEHP